jgi:hypothetical protein
MSAIKAIKSKKWYQNQITARRNAVERLAQSIDNPYNPSPERLVQMQQHNSSIQKQCREIYAEINQLEYEFALYYRR